MEKTEKHRRWILGGVFVMGEILGCYCCNTYSGPAPLVCFLGLTAGLVSYVWLNLFYTVTDGELALHMISVALLAGLLIWTLGFAPGERPQEMEGIATLGFMLWIFANWLIGVILQAIRRFAVRKKNKQVVRGFEVIMKK
jgi:hypothetical protein